MLNRLSITQVLEAIRHDELAPSELVKSYLEAIDRTEGRVGAYLRVTREEAMERAALLDRMPRVGNLHGIPVAIKDNLLTKGVTTTCASRMLEAFVPPQDATVVKRLFDAGAVMLGKANMDEFAMGSSTENSAFLTTKNPHDLGRVPGGSSGGSAAAVAACEAAFALGSDTGGSIRQPAAFCGVVGMKPTYGTVSRSGLVAFASSLDQVGAMTRSAADMALVMTAIMGHDPMDATSVDRSYGGLASGLNGPIKGMRLALPVDFLGEGLDPEIREAIYAAADHFESEGAIVEEVELSTVSYALPAYYLLSSAEASSNLARFDGVKYGHRTDVYEDYQELIRKSRAEGFGREVKRRILLGTYALSAGYYDAYYKKAQQTRELIYRDFERIFSTYDAVLSPVAPTTAYGIGEKTQDPLEMYLGDIYTVPVNIAGLPAISVNAGYDGKGLPIGMQLIGAAFSEGTLLRLAHQFETTSCIERRMPRGIQ
jgi:aspartyl-tRNA(Asn)/glutamyl-tRNA(Gln) amidotransferase subunit A